MPSHDGRTDARLDEASANGTKIDGPWRVRSDHCAAAAATTYGGFVLWRVENSRNQAIITAVRQADAAMWV